ncbi:hypothetical protein [Acetobacterium woodii]|uniref:hypothetical protein n=1 Tax=Acetobacterium woodii TaxID=33952 RepID=UPI0002F2983A|nr:hypothetical protein [Acetobacterium woodii]
MKKVARQIMEILEENNMTLFLDETNQIYLFDSNQKAAVCLNDMRDSFEVEVLKNEPTI